MPIHVSIDKERKLILTKVTESYSIGEMLEAIRAVVTHTDFEPGFNILSDHTDISRVITAEQIKHLTDYLKLLSEVMRHSRWAIVTTNPASFGMMRMLATYAEKIPMEVAVFSSRPDAERWLASIHS